MRCFVLSFTVVVLAGCGSDAESTASVSDSGMDGSVDTAIADVTSPDADPDTPTVVDAGEDDVLADAVELEDAGEPHSCGGLTCAATEVCTSRCLCCGVDTGNPADQQTAYECVAPPDDCDSTPSECVRDISGNGDCYPSDELLVECP
jgi:hypothetical protein